MLHTYLTCSYNVGPTCFCDVCPQPKCNPKMFNWRRRNPDILDISGNPPPIACILLSLQRHSTISKLGILLQSLYLKFLAGNIIFYLGQDSEPGSRLMSETEPESDAESESDPSSDSRSQSDSDIQGQSQSYFNLIVQVIKMAGQYAVQGKRRPSFGRFIS